MVVLTCPTNIKHDFPKPNETHAIVIMDIDVWNENRASMYRGKDMFWRKKAPNLKVHNKQTQSAMSPWAEWMNEIKRCLLLRMFSSRWVIEPSTLSVPSDSSLWWIAATQKSEWISTVEHCERQKCRESWKECWKKNGGGKRIILENG